jgi:spore coat protein A, manganese oxidase
MKLTRRQVLGGLGFAGYIAAQSDENTSNMLAGVWLEPFVDPLPVPRVLVPATRNGGVEHYRIEISEFRQKLHRDLPPTIVWGFEGAMPGPTIAAERGRMVEVEWVNKLPARHRLTIDHGLCGAGKNVPEVRTAIHLHGGHVAAASDGYPDDWVTPGNSQKTIYPNRQPGATLWYHDHAMGITRLNAMMGLAGFYILNDPEERRLGLPSGPYDVPLILQDRTLDSRGQINYPTGPKIETPWVPEFFGTHLLVNGRVWPYFAVEPRPYRFRLLNASNSRVYQLSLLSQQPLLQIASDGGLLAEPASRDSLLLMPGERADVIIDFRGREGRHLMLANDAPAPYPSGGTPGARLVIRFRCRPPWTPTAMNWDLPARLADVPRLREDAAVKTRRHLLVEKMSANGTLHETLLNGMKFNDPITEDPRKGTVEIWEMVNTTMDAHPIHLHAVHFQLLDRCRFDVKRHLRTSEVVLTGTPFPPSAGESGLKDTILCPPGQVTRIITPFQGEPGRFVWHCHMLEHEDKEMMRPYLLKS